MYRSLHHKYNEFEKSHLKTFSYFSYKSIILVYPNPVSDVLHIETTNGTSIDKVILYDISGRAVKEYQNITNGISISSLEKGIYIMQTFSGKQSQTEKIIIK